jgi:NAD(P)-dependent dehydrogenase (short-subunit alcohol dehydrogenase family)
LIRERTSDEDRTGHGRGVVTGGASRLGKASAKAFADASMKVAFFDINDEAGKAHARAIGGTFHHAEMMGEARVVPGFAAARAATGQERVTFHCAMTSRRGKTLGWGK